jgi:uncharacterized membrane protein
MRSLRVLVIVMGVLILLMTGVVISVIAARLAQTRREAASATIAVPAGAHIEAMTSSADRVILALVLADGSRQLLVIDLEHGRKLATIQLRPAP